MFWSRFWSSQGCHLLEWERHRGGQGRRDREREGAREGGREGRREEEKWRERERDKETDTQRQEKEREGESERERGRAKERECTYRKMPCLTWSGVTRNKRGWQQKRKPILQNSRSLLLVAVWWLLDVDTQVSCKVDLPRSICFSSGWPFTRSIFIVKASGNVIADPTGFFPSGWFISPKLSYKVDRDDRLWASEPIHRSPRQLSAKLHTGIMTWLIGNLLRWVLCPVQYTLVWHSSVAFAALPFCLQRGCFHWTAAEGSASRLNWKKEKRTLALACPCLFPLTKARGVLFLSFCLSFFGGEYPAWSSD